MRKMFCDKCGKEIDPHRDEYYELQIRNLTRRSDNFLGVETTKDLCEECKREIKVMFLD